MEEEEKFLQDRWMVLRLDVKSNIIMLYETFEDERDAMIYMVNLVENEDEFKDDIWYKKMIEEQSISIYKCGWFFKKELLYRYFMKHY